MRVAAIYDIHGNIDALDAVLAEIRSIRPDRIVVGGDVVLGPFPVEALERVLELGETASFIRGNTEREVLKAADPAATLTSPWAGRARWVAERLTAAQREILGRWPEHAVLDVDAIGPTLFCHGTPRSDEEIVTRLTPLPFLREVLAGVEQSLVVSGHTHVQSDLSIDRIRWINAGSVGMPYEGRPGAHWALLGPDVELRRTEYDHVRAAQSIAASGFPDGEAFARQYVLEPGTAEAASAQFEKMAVERRARSTG